MVEVIRKDLYLARLRKLPDEYGPVRIDVKHFWPSYFNREFVFRRTYASTKYFQFFFDKKTKKSKNSHFLNSRNARGTLEKRFMNTRMTSKNHANLQPYAWPTLCLLQFLWALSPKKALAPEEFEHRQDDDFGSKTAKKRLRNGWVAATASKTTSIFEPIGVLTWYQTSALKVYWSSSLSAPRIWGSDCNISIENLEYQMIRSLRCLLTNRKY